MARRRQRYLFGNPRAALKKADALIKIQPKNPYFHELRGDILLRANKPEEAAEAYARPSSSIRRSRASCRSPMARR